MAIPKAAAAVQPSADAAKAAYETADSLLADDQYHIEFQGYLSNHVKHAVIALHGLQAPREVIQKYWDFYTNEVPYGWHLEPAREHSGASLTSEEYSELLGKKQRFPELLEYFENEQKELGTEAVLEKYAPELIPGAAAALTHGIIQLGWALDYGSSFMVAEGLAYMAYTFLSVHPERFQSSALPETHPIDSLLRAARDFAAQNVPKDIQDIKEMPKYSLEAGWHPELHKAGFQWHLSKVLEEGHDIFLKLPEWLDTMPVEEALEGMYQAVTLLYLVSAGEPEQRTNGDFVVLHLITSLWGAEQILRKLPEEYHRVTLKCFWASALSIVATTTAGFPPEDPLQKTRDKYRAQFDAEDMHQGSTEEAGGGLCVDGAAVNGSEAAASLELLPDRTLPWAKIVHKAYIEEEEHNIKLVYVCRELWKRYGHWKAYRVAAEAFTLTPSVGPNATAFEG